MLNLGYLDEFQQKAVYSESKNTLVVAAPGSGKTTVIINRAAHLLSDKGISHENMVIITFTRAATLNMKYRYKKAFSKIESPYFCTFHSLFYKILVENGFDFRIIEQNQNYRIIKEVLSSYINEVSEEKINGIIGAISLFKINERRFESFNCPIDRKIFLECYNKIENYKEENRLYDFDDLQLKCKNLFYENPNLLYEYRKKYKYILVDEMQDSDNIQIELLKMIGNDSSIFAVGDEDQSIYGFRGARPDCMVNFQNYFDGGIKIYLCKNYRSSNNIIYMSKNLIKNNEMRNSKEIFANKNCSGIIKMTKTPDEVEQIKILIEELDDHIKQDNNHTNNVILYRTNAESEIIVEELIRRGVNFRFLEGQYSYLQHFIVKDMISYLKLSSDYSDVESFIRIVNKPNRFISKLNLEKLRTNKYKEDCFEKLINIEKISINQMKELNNLRKQLKRIKKMDIAEALEYIYIKIEYNKYLLESCKRNELNYEDMDRLFYEFKGFMSGFSNVEELAAFENKTGQCSKDDRVILSTIHGVKGMEFNNVYIVNCVEEHLPYINSISDNLEEERRLFYVAITRAIDNLYLYIPEKINGKKKLPSRFINECVNSSFVEC